MIKPAENELNKKIEAPNIKDGGPDDDELEGLPIDIENPPAKSNEPIPSQEIVGIETPDGYKISIGSQVVTAVALVPYAVGIYDHLTKDKKQSKTGGYVG